MALKNEAGNYFKVSLENFNKGVMFLVYEDEAHRIAGETEFHRAKREYVDFEEVYDAFLVNFEAFSGTSDEDNIKSALYALAKTKEPYNMYTDC